MSGYVAFLRGVNLGPHRRVTGAALREAFTGMGLRDVATFRASGNVVFFAEESSPAELAPRIEEQLAAALGFEVAIFLRSASEVRAIAAHEPFPAARLEASNGKLQVAMLAAKPPAALRKQVLALATEEDGLGFEGRELYWLPSGRMIESALDIRAIEGLLGPWTMRTKGTVEQLAAKYFSQAEPRARA
jgi:uncharacterized protein (DUF1697 family)